MDYVEFFEKLKMEDSRVEYSVINEGKHCCITNIPAFYKIVNPINVEFEYNDAIVRLVPFDELEEINKEYLYIDSGCVFATCNGEPIYEKNKKIVDALLK